MKFSIIVPLFNKSNYIVVTLKSVLEQTCGNFELIVIDDGSTDDGPFIVQSFKDPRIKLVRKANEGVSATRNLGISLAAGEWICFLDADDWFHPDYLACLSKTIEAHPDINIVATQYKSIPDTNNWSPSAWVVAAPNYEAIDDLPSRWIKAIPFCTDSIAIRRSTLVSFSPWFPVGESFGEDLDLWFRLAEIYPIVLLTQPLVAYRTAVSGGLINQNTQSVTPPFLYRMRERALGLPKESSIRSSSLRLVTHQLITQARLDAANGQRGKALALLLEIRDEGAKLKRWWVTFAMALLVPRRSIHQWQLWRKRRTINH